MHRPPLCWHTLAPEPWKNGGGSTRTLAVSSLRREVTEAAGIDQGVGRDDRGGPANWRVSIAEIVRNGVYSRFAGYERLSVVLSGAGVVLRHADTVVELRPGIPVVFDGDPAWQSTLIGGPVSVLNLFVRRGKVQACVTHEGSSGAAQPVHLGAALAQGFPLVSTRIIVTTAAQPYRSDDGQATLALSGNEFWIESPSGGAPRTGLHAIVISLSECSAP